MAKKKKTKKPDKPYPDFPLSSASNGQWCKKVKGKIHYFGVWADPDSALKKWLDIKDRLYAGLSAPKEKFQGASFRKVVNVCLTAMKKEATANPKKKRHFKDCKDIADLFKPWVAIDFPIDGLMPEDFRELKTILSKSKKKGVDYVGLMTLHNRLSKARLFLNFGRKNKLFQRHVDDLIGTALDLPSKTDLNIEKNQNPEKLFETHEIRGFIENASGTLLTCILLSINCGFGATDIGTLERSHIDGDFVRLARGKTGKRRAAWLWPETKMALEESIAHAKQFSDSLCVMTKYGNSITPRYSKSDIRNDPMSTSFYRLRKKLGFFRTGVGLYSLRHSFQTIADELELLVTTSFVMGHADESMSGNYRHRVSDENIEKVCRHVRKRVLG